MRVLRVVQDYIIEFRNTISQKMWSVQEAQRSSSYRDLKAISWVSSHLVKGHNIKWYTDNQSVSRIVELGSMKEDLQCFAFHMHFKHVLA